MANRSYLCATNKRAIYPSFVDKSYSPDAQTIANDVWGVPLLWTALFRPQDIVTQTFDADGEKVYVETPLTTLGQAVVQLDQALPYFNSLFSDEGALDEYAAFLKTALLEAPYKFITIEMEEIASLYEEQEFYKLFRQVLESIGGPPDPSIKEALVQIAQFRNLDRFTPAKLSLDPKMEEAATDDEVWNHCRVCGAGRSESGIGRPVPWEARES